MVLTVGCGSSELPVPQDPYRYSRELTPVLVFLTAPVYTPSGQAIVFTRQVMGYGGWVILQRRGEEDWSIKETTTIPQY